MGGGPLIRLFDMGIGFGPSPTSVAPPAISPPAGLLPVPLRPFDPFLPLSHTLIHTTYLYLYYYKKEK
uniref:Uncharacterized protein n=1 Tax=Helianthus annuus TaxID=4232 RepID=A0A251U5U7_HELAN